MTKIQCLLVLTLLVGCAKQKPPPRITFLTVNTANGFGMGDFRTPEARARQAQFLRDQNPDVLALQEVERYTSRVGGVATDEEIVPPGGTLYFVKCADLEDGVTGLSLWVGPRVTILDKEPIGLDYSAFIDGTLASDPWVRITAYGLLQVEDFVFGVSAVHLTSQARDSNNRDVPADDIRHRQIEESTMFDPEVIMGDFNALPSQIGEQLIGLGYEAATHGALDSIWWKLKGTGKMILLHDDSDHPGAALAVTK